jgi:hypothetical protein
LLTLSNQLQQRLTEIVAITRLKPNSSVGPHQKTNLVGSEANHRVR